MDAKTMRALGKHLILEADKKEKKIKNNIKEKSYNEIMTPEMVKITLMIEEKKKKKNIKKEGNLIDL